MPYNVEKILDHMVVCRNNTDKLCFLVKWEHYSQEHSTWEPAGNFLPGYNLPWVRYCIDKNIAMDIKQLLPAASTRRR